ncbi:alkaline phosphatase D family protein [uncultured Paraglaciecola sp.]|uniref:alkaline phosphatase D family protein n=1 Tax=uncultured Paraglaciecola sp. TaxID=1765024 RepID=UPI0026143AB8|nr:alkaline phosphatase D family protein [uncultured Paraglaciecola sp.]
MSTFTRRDFLRIAATTSGSLVVSTQLTGCASFSKPALSSATFTHGVASGDPLASSVILWSRALPVSPQSQVTVAYEVSLDNEFKQVIRSGSLTTDASKDFTLKLDVTGLAPATSYYYRFISAENQSVVGHTKTLPVGEVSQLKFAVFSCSNYPAGYFNAYMDASKRSDIDVVLHLGDYIYEYPMGGYATSKAKKIGRELAPDNQTEILNLADYRKRYATYRTDKGLLALHAAQPFIVVWDDHEVCNDTWREGAQNHTPDEGDFFKRRAAAVQAYYEWLPIRPPMGDGHPQIYRSFDFGDLLSLHMLDTRVIARDKQLEYKAYQSADGFNGAQFKKDISAPDRALIGQQQFNWLAKSIEQSNAKWQLLGQQVLMTKMHFPAEIFASSDRTKFAPVIAELAQIKRALLQGKVLTEQQLARVQTVMPYNLDAWDGYPMEREKLYAVVNKLNKKLLVVAGDTHNAWQGQLKDHQGKSVGVEFATPGVSSPGMEKYLKLNTQQADELSKALSLLIDDLQYCNLHQRGYLTLTVNPDKVQANWYFVDTILKEDFAIANTHQAEFNR